MDERCTNCGQVVYSTFTGWTTDEDDEDENGYFCPETGNSHYVDEES